MESIFLNCDKVRKQIRFIGGVRVSLNCGNFKRDERAAISVVLHHADPYNIAPPTTVVTMKKEYGTINSGDYVSVWILFLLLQFVVCLTGADPPCLQFFKPFHRHLLFPLQTINPPNPFCRRYPAQFRIVRGKLCQIPLQRHLWKISAVLPLSLTVLKKLTCNSHPEINKHL